MDLASFLSLIRSSGKLPSHSVILFKANDYPLIFSSLFFSALKTKQLPIDSLDCSSGQMHTIIAQLEMSFLGMSCLYRLKELENLDAKQRQLLIPYLQHYKGPHTLLGFISSDFPIKKTETVLLVDIPESLSVDCYDSILDFFEKGIARKNLILKKKLFSPHAKMSVDAACLLMHYGQVIGKDTNQFCDQWLDGILLPEHSLFTLSQYFFAKDIQAFFKQWQSIADNFSMPFWITFWSEQLWRATYFISYQEQQQFSQARKIGYRLPFSFLQRDWKKHSIKNLTRAHNALYDLDFRLKNSGEDQISLDLFYSKFFNN